MPTLAISNDHAEKMRAARLGRALCAILIVLIWCMQIPRIDAETTVSNTNTNTNANGCKLHENEVSFMKRCYCKPGWISSVTRPQLRCDKPLHEIGRCQCGVWNKEKTEIYMSSDPKEHNKYVDTIEQFGGNDASSHLRCYNLCRSTPEVGVPISHPGEWNDNLYWKQIGFYTKELRICSLNLRHSHMRQRLDEFTISYSHFAFLNGYKSLGNVIEYGAGGYTQTRNILERHDIHVDKVTLVDPLLYPYGKLEGGLGAFLFFRAQCGLCSAVCPPCVRIAIYLQCFVMQVLTPCHLSATPLMPTSSDRLQLPADGAEPRAAES